MVFDPDSRTWKTLDPDVKCAGHTPIIPLHKLETGDVYKLDDDDEPMRIRATTEARGDEATHLALAIEYPDGTVVTAITHRTTFVIPLAPEPLPIGATA
jgi:hypothetical protein